MLFVGIKNKFISTKNDKRAYGQVCFWKYHSTIDNLAAGWVLLEKSHLREKGLYCGFIGFIKAINMVLNERLWRCMEELGVPNEYMLAIPRIYEKVVSCVYGDEISDCFNALTALGKDLNSHKLYLVYVLMIYSKWLSSL
mgnify:CR=1 FL=1